jgi:hypothetical protein
MKTNVSRLRLLLAQYQDYARDTEAKGPTALKGKFDWEEYLAHNDAQLQKAAEVCEELLDVIKCEKDALINTKRHIEMALIHTIRHLTEVSLDMLPFKGQCDECKYKNDHPWPPCNHKVWSYLRPIEQRTIQSGVLSCMVRDTSKDGEQPSQQLEGEYEGILHRKYLNSGLEDLMSFADYKENLKRREDVAGRCTK